MKLNTFLLSLFILVGSMIPTVSFGGVLETDSYFDRGKIITTNRERSDLFAECSMVNNNLSFNQSESFNVNASSDFYMLINNEDTIVFDFSQALCTSGMIEVPVFFLSDELVWAIDFEMKFNPSEFTYNSFVSHQSYLNNAANFQIFDSTLRFSAFSMTPIDTDTPLISLRFNVPSGVIGISSFSLIRGYLNGDLCSYKSINLPPAPPIFSGGVTSLQTGDSLLLSISIPSGFTNVWSVGSTSSSIYVNSAGTYSVAVTNNLGCTATSFITVTLSNPLPVELLSFEGIVSENGIQLFWTTASEISNDYFIVQRSSDLEKWNSLSRIEGNGTCSNLSQYNYYDSAPAEGRNYYMLKQVDFDGGYGFSPVILLNYVDEKQANSNMHIFPNPAAAGYVKLIVSLPGNSEGDLVSIFDLNGRELYRQVLNDERSIGMAGIKHVEISNHFNPGMYLVKWVSGGSSHQSKWVVY